jgi:uncharacterized protein YndB with AHSA1/START domain
MTEAIRSDVVVEVRPERAFEVFAAELGCWWPAEYSWSQDVLEEIGIEQREGGMCFERGPYGFRCDWGRVLAWEPPERLTIAWQVTPRREPEPNPAKASEVEVRFIPEGEGRTTVRLEHRAFERHGEDGGQYAQMLGSPRGWPFLLERFASACGRDSSG